MKLYRVYFRNGSWFDVKARFMDVIDDHIWLWEQTQHEAVAIVPDGDVLMVAIKDSVANQFIVPDDTHCLTVRDSATGDAIEVPHLVRAVKGAFGTSIDPIPTRS